MTLELTALIEKMAKDSGLKTINMIRVKIVGRDYNDVCAQLEDLGDAVREQEDDTEIVSNVDWEDIAP